MVIIFRIISLHATFRGTLVHISVFQMCFFLALESINPTENNNSKSFYGREEDGCWLFGGKQTRKEGRTKDEMKDGKLIGGVRERGKTECLIAFSFTADQSWKNAEKERERGNWKNAEKQRAQSVDTWSKWEKAVLGKFGTLFSIWYFWKVAVNSAR